MEADQTSSETDPGIDPANVSHLAGDASGAAMWFIACMKFFLKAKGFENQDELAAVADRLEHYAETLPERDRENAKRAARWTRHLLAVDPLVKG